MKPFRKGRLDHWIEQDNSVGVKVAIDHLFPVIIDSGGLGRLSRHVEEALLLNDCKSVFVALDANVRQHYGEIVEFQLAAAGLPSAVHVVEAREDGKTLRAVEDLWSALDAAKAVRRTMVISIGGGNVSDIVGFAAQTYLRGLPLTIVPTTLLAQVDAGVGGKNGVSFLGKKNRLGGFHQPALTMIDPSLLMTLSRSAMAEGFAEAVKIALLTSEELVADLEAIQSSPDWAETSALNKMITNSVRRKLALLSSDPHEFRSLDRALNLGHCIGHPLEEVLEYKVGHGAAVSVGICVAAKVGVRRGMTSVAQHERIVALLGSFGLPTTVDPELRDALWEALGSVREVRNGQLRLVVPVEPGRWEIVPDISYREWGRALCL